MTDALVATAIEELDKDKDGVISKKEFISWGKTCDWLMYLIEQLNHDLLIPAAVECGSSSSLKSRKRLRGNGGLKIEDIPTELMEIFKQSGITEKELEDPETAALCMNVIAKYIPETKQNAEVSYYWLFLFVVHSSSPFIFLPFLQY
eukprot:TRINITY_DN3360_c0_g1_i4.p1 TRINITY_DN3360_c0_g1~~TRINITY_DN3360_c0_g1_i4.p1  ORF type:complete len:159 (-),score=23.61 TRINITY_DN3360_c0_g1_i4:132-572(-)